MGAGMNMGAQHSQTIYAMLTAVPGSQGRRAVDPVRREGLLLQAIRDDDPVMFFEHKALYPRKGEVPDGDYTVPFGEAALVRAGEHVTVVAIGRMVSFAEKALDVLAKEGISCDLIDPRTTSPLDEETILESVEGTGRLVVVDESPPALQHRRRHRRRSSPRTAFHALKAPVDAGHRAALTGAVRARARACLRAGSAAHRSGDPPGPEGLNA